MIVIVGHLVSIHCVGCTHGFFDMAHIRDTLLYKDFGILPINHVVMLDSMVCDSRFRLLTF